MCSFLSIEDYRLIGGSEYTWVERTREAMRGDWHMMIVQTALLATQTPQNLKPTLYTPCFEDP